MRVVEFWAHDRGVTLEERFTSFRDPNCLKATSPTYQWRSPIIAAVEMLKGEAVSGPSWKLPQPTITQVDLDRCVNDKMPPLHYAMCGCEDLPGYSQR